MTRRDLLLLLRLNKSWYPGISADDLYEVTRAWWVMSRSNADRVDRVLAVADGIVREVYEPHRWVPSPEPGLENRIGFEGVVADDRANWIGSDVSGHFRQGSANPVRYLPTSAFLPPTANPDIQRNGEQVHSTNVASGPGLAESVQPLVDAFEDDLMWAQSRAAQELFHSNTIAWLLDHHPAACGAVIDLLGDHSYGRIESLDVRRELHDLDIVIDPHASPGIVVENKLYSVPYRRQLLNYLEKSLPWSSGHGASGAADTQYVLLSLMQPAFMLPNPWRHVGYDELLDALKRVEADSLGSDTQLFERYVALVRRLVSLADGVDPAKSVDEPFLIRPADADMFRAAGLDGAVARMRFSGLTELVRQAVPSHRGEFEVGGGRGGIVTYDISFTPTRRIGWQFQDGQLRYFIALDEEGLRGKGLHDERAAVVESQYQSFFDHADVADVLGDALKPYSKAVWLRFDPDFVYRHRPVERSVTTASLVEALVVMTQRVDRFAEEFHD